MSDTQRWLDLSHYGMSLVCVQAPSSKIYFLVRNGDKHADALRALGFRRNENLGWYTTDHRLLNPGRFKKKGFPEAEATELPKSEIYVRLEGKATVQEAHAQDDVFKCVGINSRKQAVYETAEGERFTAPPRANRLYESKTITPSPDVFLRGNDPSAVAACIEGYIETRFAAPNEEYASPEAFSLTCGIEDQTQFNADVEASVIRRVVRRGNLALQERFASAIALKEALKGTPAADLAHNLSLAVCGRRMLGSDRDLIGSRVFLPVFDPEVKRFLLPRATRAVDRGDEFDASLRLVNSESEAIKAAKENTAASRSIIFVPVKTETAAKKLLKKISGITQIEDSAFIPGKTDGVLCLVTFGHKGMTEDPAEPVSKNIVDLWSWASSHTVERSQAMENARSGLSVNAKFMSADPSLANNEFQKPYVSLSKVNAPTTMIPQELDGATRKALDRVAASFGDIDKTMAREFGYTDKEFAEVFAPEQVDGLALAVHAESRGRGFLFADGTGVGKGRECAAMIARAVAQGRKVIFLSEQVPNLADMQRDIKHIGRLGTVKPLVFNSNAKLIDEDTDRPFETHDDEMLERTLDQGGWPEGINAVYMTYTQVNRKPEDSRRSAWLDSAVDENTVLVVDEVHNASSGTSNTSENISNAIDRAGCVIYSSATHAATSRAVAFYNRLFPDDIDSVEIGKMMAADGEQLQEVVTNMLVSDGVMVRRELDLSGIEFSQHIDTGRMPQNRAYMDRLADIIADMAQVSMDIADTVRNFNRDEARQQDKREMRAIPFGAPLHAMTRLAAACLGAEHAADRSIEALKNGEKPVIMVDNTVQAVLDEVSQGNADKPDFKVVVHRVFSQLTKTYVSVVDDSDNLPALVEGDPAVGLTAAMTGVRAKIDALPDLSASVIDVIKSRIEKEGFSCGEITGRTHEFRDGEVVPRKSRDKTTVKNGFNSGAHDALLMNVSSATGVDLHASRRFKDQRRRVFIEAQAPQSVQRQIQSYGRTSRRDQVSFPRVELLSAGLPNEIRLAVMRNRRLRRMSANVTSSRDSAFLTNNIPDIINSVGDRVISNYAEMRPDLLKKLCLDPESNGRRSYASDEFAAEAQRDTKHTANTFLARLSLLNTDFQDKILSELFAEYTFHLAELEAQGENPLRPRQVEGIVHMGESKLFEGAISGSDDNSFNGPLYLQEGRVERVVPALTSENVLDAVSEGSKCLAAVSKAAANLSRNRDVYLETYLSGGSQNVDEALAKGDMRVEEIRRKMEDLSIALASLAPGRGLKITNHDGVQEDAIVTRVHVPGRGFEHIPQQYRVELAIPGETKLKTYFVNTLLKMPGVCDRTEEGDLILHSNDGLEGDDYDRVLDAFNNATSKRLSRAQFLTSNIFRGARIATKHKVGSLVSFVDADGVRHKGIMVKRGFEKKLAFLSKRIDSAEGAITALIGGGVNRITTNPATGRAAITVRSVGSKEWVISLPRPTRRGEKTFWRSDDYREMHGAGVLDERGASTRRIKGDSELRRSLAILKDAGYNTFYADGKPHAEMQDTSSENERVYR
ncbi:strawberry notch-like NTP hydrolase domain-containing protein [Roseibium sp. RKSG952]|uniref:strawberry notch-like NTP hydrolase domain-containing protein n=1 Tax=Roseibium sp. RKSG952 TaxID=2529384 RepID=UPI0012BBF1FF|nr:strawberry notch family protein [Roseibium sp. RKSG952]MTH95983.1 hypothetical protein [Roseibium sp. RKSG952]